MDTLVTVGMIMGLSFGVVVVGYVLLAVLYLPMYLMGGRRRNW